MKADKHKWARVSTTQATVITLTKSGIVGTQGLQERLRNQVRLSLLTKNERRGDFSKFGSRPEERKAITPYDVERRIQLKRA